MHLLCSGPLDLQVSKVSRSGVPTLSSESSQVWVLVPWCCLLPSSNRNSEKSLGSRGVFQGLYQARKVATALVFFFIDWDSMRFIWKKRSTVKNVFKSVSEEYYFSRLSSPLSFFINLNQRICLLILERGERETSMWEKSIGCLRYRPWTCNLGLCPDLELHPWPFDVRDNAPTNWATRPGISSLSFWKQCQRQDMPYISLEWTSWPFSCHFLVPWIFSSHILL